MTRAGEASPKLPHLPPRLQRPAPGRYLGPRQGSTPNRQRRVAPGAARSGSGCGSQAAGRGPPPTPAVEPPSGDDPARRLPHPQCSLWACRAVPSCRGVWGGASGYTNFPGPQGRPASQHAMGRSGRTIAVRGRTWAGRPDTPPQRTPHLVCAMGGPGLTNAERGKPGTGNLDTPPHLRRNRGAERCLSLRRTMGLSGRTIADPGRVGRGFRTLPLGASREARAKRVGIVALSAPRWPGMRAGSTS